jgi:purine catabolism regulator
MTEQLASQVARQVPGIIGAGRTATSAKTLNRTLREAQQVVDSVRPGDELGPGGGVFRLEDVHVRGLLTLLGEDDRLHLFVSREFEALKAHDEKHGSQLMETLRALLEHESKVNAASRVHLSRAAFYARLTRIENVLGVRLDDVEIRTSLHVALIADDLAAGRGGDGSGGAGAGKPSKAI